MRVALVDYRAGNLTSVRKALGACGADVFMPRDPSEIAAAAALVVPGVGHFEATGTLDAGWRGAIRDAIDRGLAVLGICLGLQWLFEGSDEAPGLPGLGVLEGHCTLLGGGPPAAPQGSGDGDAPGPAIKVPHVGWNSLEITHDSPILAGVRAGAQAYFTHSYAAPVTPATVATTTHGGTFASAVARGRVFGVQFHPEKSGPVGLTLLHNFLQQAAGGRSGTRP